MGSKRETLIVERIPLQFRLDPNGFGAKRRKHQMDDCPMGDCPMKAGMKACPNGEDCPMDEGMGMESGRFSGIASVFGSIVDTYPQRTRFREGAFLKTLNDRGNRVKILSQHNDLAIPIGLPTKLQETKDGLYFEASLNNTTLGKDWAEALRHARSLGKLDSAELSIGFDALNCDMVEDEEDKEVFREITEARLWEISLVAFGADRQTKVMEANRLEMLKADRESTFAGILSTLKSLREGAAPFKEHAPLTEAQRKQLTEELALHAPAEPPIPALTEYERQRQLSAIKQAEAEMAFAGI